MDFENMLSTMWNIILLCVSTLVVTVLVIIALYLLAYLCFSIRHNNKGNKVERERREFRAKFAEWSIYKGKCTNISCSYYNKKLRLKSILLSIDGDEAEMHTICRECGCDVDVPPGDE